MFFVDNLGVANKTGLRFAAILVLLLNTCFLLMMATLIARAGYSDAWALVRSLWRRAKELIERLFAKCVCGHRSPSATYQFDDSRARVSHRPSTERLVGVQLSHRGSSMELLRNTIFTRSGAILENGDSALER